MLLAKVELCSQCDDEWTKAAHAHASSPLQEEYEERSAFLRHSNTSATLAYLAISCT